MFRREASRVRNRWILEASNIRPSLDRGQRCSKHLILLIFLAPRPGLEPGTYGLTVDRSIYPQTGMNAVPSLPVAEGHHDAIVRASAAFGKMGWKRHTALCCRRAASRSGEEREG